MAKVGGIEIDTDGDHDLRRTGTTKLPDNLTVGGTIYGVEAAGTTPARPADQGRGGSVLTKIDFLGW